MTTPSDDLQDIMRSALDAIKRGDRETARRLAEQANILDPGSEKPWLIMAALAEPHERVPYIRRALQIDPQSQEAQQALAWALKRESDHPAPVEKPAAKEVVLSQFVPPPPPAFEAPAPARISSEPAAAGDTQPVTVVSSLSAIKWFSFADRRWLPYALTGLALVVVVVILFATQPKVAAIFRPDSANPGCDEPRLVVGTASFAIQSADLAEGGALPAAPQDPGTALWVGGTSPHFVLLLNSSTQNQFTLASLQPRAVIRIRWADCTQEIYAMHSLDVRPDFNLSQVDQTRSGITLVLFMDAGQAMLVTGEVPPTPIP